MVLFAYSYTGFDGDANFPVFLLYKLKDKMLHYKMEELMDGLEMDTTLYISLVGVGGYLNSITCLVCRGITYSPTINIVIFGTSCYNFMRILGPGGELTV